MKKLIISLSIIAFISACKKEEITECAPNNETGSSEKGYYPLSIGSYWVYENYFIDSLENEGKLSEIDSVVITNDTVINWKQYYVFRTYNSLSIEVKPMKTVRDSLGYIVDQNGDVLFSSTNFTDTLHSFTEVNPPSDTIYTATFQMVDKNDHVTVPAGTFRSITYEGTYYIYPKHQTSTNSWSTGAYYSNNVGLVLDYYHYISIKARAERRLARYHIK